jgi:exonuclease III
MKPYRLQLVQALHVGDRRKQTRYRKYKCKYFMFYGHWLPEVQMDVLNIDDFKLASNFSRKQSKAGGSYIFIRNNIQTEQVEYLQELGKEMVFEIFATEMTDNTILTCIYRSPDSDFYEFLFKLELLIGKMSSKGKHLILCGDLNIIFFKYSGKLLDLQNVLLMNNLTNIIKSPTRITNHSVSLIDVIIVNNINKKMFTGNMDLGYSDHLAQLLYVKTKMYKMKQ